MSFQVGEHFQVLGEVFRQAMKFPVPMNLAVPQL
jgi:hypothetical protein